MSEDALRRNLMLKSVLDHAREIIEDGVVTEAEAAQFHEWLERHPELYAIAPANLIILQLRRIFADGRATEDERLDLLELLRTFTGEGSIVPPEEWGKLDRGER